jgi:hypothetical protein
MFLHMCIFRNVSVIFTLLDLAFTNISDLSVSVSNYPLVAPDNYHPPLVLEFKLFFSFSICYVGSSA